MERSDCPADFTAHHTGLSRAAQAASIIGLTAHLHREVIRIRASAPGQLCGDGGRLARRQLGQQQFQRPAHEAQVRATYDRRGALHDQGDFTALQVRVLARNRAQLLKRAAIHGFVKLGEFAGNYGLTLAAELC